MTKIMLNGNGNEILYGQVAFAVIVLPLGIVAIVCVLPFWLIYAGVLGL